MIVKRSVLWVVIWGWLTTLPLSANASILESWLDAGWQQVNKHHYQQALKAWQDGVNRQPNERIFPVLGTYAGIEHALAQVERIGKKQKGFIVRKQQQNKTLFYVLSARKTPPRGEARSKQLADLIQVAGITPPLLGNAAEHFKSTMSSSVSAQQSTRKIHQKAIILARKGFYEQALNMLAPYAKKPERFPKIAIDRMVILTWSRQYGDAIQAFEQRPANLKVPNYLRFAMGDAYFHLHSFTQALAMFSAIPEQAAEFEKAIQGKLQTLIAMHRFDKAWAMLPKVAHTPIATQIFLAMATAHFDSGFDIWLHQLSPKTDSMAIVNALKQQLGILSAQQQAHITDQLKTRTTAHHARQILRYLLWLSWLNDPRDKQLEVDAKSLSKSYSTEQLSHIGWVLYRVKRYKQAEAVFLAAHMQNTDHFKADLGLAYSELQNGHIAPAAKILQHWRKEYADNAEFLYALAFLHEKQKDFWGAVQAYGRILEQYPHDNVARRLQLTALSNLGASSHAWEEAKRYLPNDKAFYKSLKNRQAVVRLHWDEAPDALRILEPLLKEQFRGARFDHIPALISNNQATAAVHAYEQLLTDGYTPPLWLQQTAAGAYLTVEQRETSLHLYNHVLKSRPKSYDARVGKFYCLFELQRWQEADRVLQSLEKEHLPWSFGRFPNERLNPQRMTVAMARATWLTGQQRYTEAENYLQKLYISAPGNIDVRKALASLHQQRGWHRQALREYNIIAAMQARDVIPPSTLGLSEAMNVNEYKEQARQLLQVEQTRHPRAPRVIRLQRHYLIETMQGLEIGGRYENSQDGAIDRLVYARYIHPLGLHTNLFGETMLRRSSQGNLSAAFDRIGLGFDHRFNTNWRIRETLSGDYVRQGDIGLRSELHWNPNDNWQAQFLYDSFVSDVPLRARVFDITSDHAGASITYRWSDWRDAGISLARSGFSDGNQRFEAALHYGQNLLTQYDWRLHISSNLSASRSSLANRPYFSPDRAASATITLLIEHNLWHRYEHIIGKYERWFTQRLYLTGGSYWQRGFGSGLINSLRYEQDIAFSDTHHLIWGINWGRHPYDGVQVGSYVVDAHYRWDF